MLKKTVLTDKKKVASDAKSLNIPEGYSKNSHWNLLLDFIGSNGSSISWKSREPEYISNDGKLLKSSPRKGKKFKVKMTANVTMGSAKTKKKFDVLVAYPDQEYQGYLFTYFEGSGPRQSDEQIRFGASADAINWFALNNNQPIISSEKISGTGGIRDPHILRGEDEKSFYMVATDMNTEKNGWAHNPGIVMLQSDDLIDWKHSFIDLEKSYPVQFANIQWVWALKLFMILRLINIWSILR